MYNEILNFALAGHGAGKVGVVRPRCGGPTHITPTRTELPAFEGGDPSMGARGGGGKESVMLLVILPGLNQAISVFPVSARRSVRAATIAE